MTRVAKFGAPAILCLLMGFCLGGLLYFTVLQRAAMSVSFFLLAVWLFSVVSAEPFPVFSWPSVGVPVSALFALAIWFAFFRIPTGGLTGTPAIDAAPVAFPRFLSAIISALPAIPYGVASAVGVLSGQRG